MKKSIIIISTILFFTHGSASAWWWDKKNDTNTSSNITTNATNQSSGLINKNGGNSKLSIINQGADMAANDPVVAEIAFKYSFGTLDDKTLFVKWDVRDGYKIYSDKIKFSVVGADLGKIVIPKGEMVEDDLFGKIYILKHEIYIEIPLNNIKTDTIELTSHYQGCWDGGVCYPPIDLKNTIKLGSSK